ncbi:probable RNA-directed DNA polymerase from transposon X-element [Trichonephila clavipes]|nr:probable RNA-directed DNA polymerase from transposon X-element [Trichonephila clavipes]
MLFLAAWSNTLEILQKKELLEIFNLSWATGKLPKIWKLSTVIPILKPNKNASECKNYRPISLTSTLCKLMERIIHRRLMNWLIENKKLHFYQTAFRTHHSTTDQLFYLNQSIIDGFQEKPHKKTLAVFLDISAAFDRVWRQKLVHTIQGTGINGKALLWINDFLRGRKFSVRFNGALSESRRMWAGVPQGSLCGTSWGSRPQTLKSTFCTVIRPVLEYATPIWTPASISVKRKLDSVQHRAAKIIIGAVSSTNNEKAEQECGLPPLESRRKLATIKFTNKLRSYGAPHSKKPTKEYLFRIGIAAAMFQKRRPCNSQTKGLETIAILSQDNFAIAYTDGSSDRSLSNGGAGIILLLPDGNNYKHKINTGIIASNFTSELVAIREALLLYQQNPHVIDSTEGLVIFSDSKSAIEAIRNGETNISCDIITLLEQLHNKRKSCILQWIPAHVNIEGNECADSLAKEARDIEHKCTTITLDDANAVAKHRIMNHTFKKPLVTEFDCPRIITSTIARLRTEHLKGMKIHPDKTRSYVQCKHCPDLQLTPNHILNAQSSQQSY